MKNSFFFISDCGLSWDDRLTKYEEKLNGESGSEFASGYKTQLEKVNGAIDI